MTESELDVVDEWRAVVVRCDLSEAPIPTKIFVDLYGTVHVEMTARSVYEDPRRGAPSGPLAPGFHSVRFHVLDQHLLGGPSVDTLLKIVEMAWQHELREWFLVDGKCAYDPHALTHLQGLGR